MTDELRGRFAAYVRRTLEPARRRLGVTRRPGEEVVTLLRPTSSTTGRVTTGRIPRWRG